MTVSANFIRRRPGGRLRVLNPSEGEEAHGFCLGFFGTTSPNKRASYYSATFRMWRWGIKRKMTVYNDCLKRFVETCTKRGYVFTQLDGQDYWEISTLERVLSEWEKVEE